MSSLITMAARTVFIYGLRDPRDGHIRYIGKTVDTPNHRLSVHVYQSKNANGKPTHKEAWIIGLLRESLIPEICLLEIVLPEDDWVAREQFWIADAKTKGWLLTNHSIGGGGHCGVRHTEEYKRDLAERMKGNQHAKGHKWTLEERKNHKAAVNREALSRAKKGTRHSEATKKKMSKAQKKCYAEGRRKPIVMRGEQNATSKLKEWDIRQIRQLAANKLAVKEIAKRFDISVRHTYNILCGKVWTHV